MSKAAVSAVAPKAAVSAVALTFRSGPSPLSMSPSFYSSSFTHLSLFSFAPRLPFFLSPSVSPLFLRLFFFACFSLVHFTTHPRLSLGGTVSPLWIVFYGNTLVRRWFPFKSFVLRSFRQEHL